MYKKKEGQLEREKRYRKTIKEGWREWRAKHGKIEASESRGSKCSRILNLRH